MSEAKNLASNPLGIIALFISLIYGFACLVLTYSKVSIDLEIAIPLVWFIILFPVLILFSFLFLVVFHHQKLYAPKDYKDERNFFKPIDKQRQAERLESEIVELEQDEEHISDTKSDIPIEENQESETTETQEKSHEKPKLNNREPKISEIKNTKSVNLKRNYFVVEELALRKQELEYNVNINRQIQFDYGSQKLEFDGICKIKNRYLLFEVKYIQSCLFPISVLEKIQKMVGIVEKINNIKAKLVLIVVHEKENGSEIQEQIKSHFKGNKSIQLKFYNNSKLQDSFKAINRWR